MLILKIIDIYSIHVPETLIISSLPCLPYITHTEKQILVG